MKRANFKFYHDQKNLFFPYDVILNLCDFRTGLEVFQYLETRISSASYIEGYTKENGGLIHRYIFSFDDATEAILFKLRYSDYLG